MAQHTPCRHLDYETKCGPDIKLVDLAMQGFPGVRYWHRGPTWTDNGAGERPNPARVQFCQMRGRINSVFDCYERPGPMNCWETPDDVTPADGGRS